MSPAPPEGGGGGAPAEPARSEGTPKKSVSTEPSVPLPRTVIDERGPAALLEGGTTPRKPSGPLPRTVIDEDLEAALSRAADAQQTGEMRRPPPDTSPKLRRGARVRPTGPTVLNEDPSADTMFDEVSAKRHAAAASRPLGADETDTWEPSAARARAPDRRPPLEDSAPSLSEGLEEEIGDEDGLLSGDLIHQYELIRRLGRGGMGNVWLARDTRLGRKVAVKMLTRVSPRHTERFLVEARATARCEHENIVVIHDVNELDGRPYMVLEYLEGEPLTRLLDGTPMHPLRAVELMVPVVRALVRAHEHNIVHRDLKPDNIIVRHSGTIKVLDFGIAKHYGPDATESGSAPQLADLQGLRDGGLTREGALLGTMLYMSPEQWGAGTVDHRTDLWAVGLMLYEMVSGKHPLAGRTPTELMATALALHEPMPAVGDAVPDLPGQLERIIDDCLHKRKEERWETAQALLEALQGLVPQRYGRQLSDDESPYPGLAAFQEADAARFFGRGPDVVRAVARLRDRPLVGVVGPSGVGKSSFVRAGVVPALKGSGEQWETFIVRPGRSPLAALASLIQPLTRSHTGEGTSGELTSHSALVARLRAEPGFLGSLLRKRAQQKGGSILLFVDQFEELYTLVSDPEERSLYTACLAGAADDAGAPLRVCVSMRSDFLDRAAEDQRFMEELTRGLIFLQPPDGSGLREAITGPLEQVGYRFENEQMVRRMLAALEQTPGALPLLQFSAAKLWDSRDRRARLLTQDGFDAMGGIAGALATHADEVYAGLSSADQAIAKTVLRALVTPDGTRAIVEVAELQEQSSAPDDVLRVVDYLVGERLLVTQSRSEAEGHAVEIVHESLIDSWPTFRRWQDEGHEDAVFLAQLRSAAKQWEAKGRPEGLLWRGDAMAEARLWRNRYHGELASAQQEYLDAVFELGTRSARRKRAVVVGVISVLVLAVAGSLLAVWNIRRAEQEAKDKAHIAREAERQVSQKLLQIKQEQTERARAEKQAFTEARAHKMTRAELAKSYRQLQKALKQSQQATQHAEAEKKKAEAEKKKAELATVKAREANRDTQKALEAARRAAESERKLRATTQKLLKKERENSARLRRERRQITKGLK